MSVARPAPFAAAFAMLVVATVAVAGDPAPVPAPAPAATPADLVVAMRSKETPERLDAATRAKDVQDDKLVAPLVALLADDDSAVRHAAIDALGRRTAPDAQRKAASALAAQLPKLAKKPEAEVELIAAAQALGALAQPSSLDALMSGIESDTTPDVVKARLTAVANLPSPEAIDALIQFLAKQGRGRNAPQREACRAALRNATGENFGNEPDAWRAWWKDARKTFDFAAAAQRRAAEKQANDDREKHKHEKKDKKDDGGEGKK